MRFPGFIGPSYTLQSVNVDCQRCVNLFPEVNALGTGKEQEVAALVPTPGLRTLLTLPETPIRGMWRASNGELFVVAGSKFYSVDSAWVSTERGSLATSSGPVSLADNGLQVVVVDGVYGYYYTLGTAVFTQITDPNFYAADQVAFLDGYFIFNKKGSQQFFISPLNAVEPFDGLDIASAEGSPDNLVGLITTNQNLFLFGSQSTEVYYDSGDADFPLARIQGAVIDVGLAAPFSLAKIGNAIYFLGGDSTGSGIIYRMQGYQPQRISTPAIEAVIRKISQADLAEATAYAYQQGGHLFYCLNIPTHDATWVYDASTNLWHERAYLNLWNLERHRAEHHAVAYGENVVSDYETGKLYALDLETYTDDSTPIARIRTSPHFSKGLGRVFHSSIQLDMETGVGLTAPAQGSDPKAVLQWSDDGGHSWSNEHWADVGKIGETRARVIWRRLGSSRDRVYRVTITDPVKVVLIGAELDVQGGLS